MPDALWDRMQGTEFPTEDVCTTYAVGDTCVSGAERGTVVSVGGDEYPTISVVWSEGQRPIVYPADAPYLRRAMPWEV